MLEHIEHIPVIGWISILILGSFFSAFLFILVKRRQIEKLSIFGNTVEFRQDGQTHIVDTISVMYIMRNMSEKIEAATRDELNDIPTTLEHLIARICPISCVMLCVQIILLRRIRNNSFEELNTESAKRYALSLSQELLQKILKEKKQIYECKSETIDIDVEKIKTIAIQFMRLAVHAHYKECVQKADMYRQFLPFYEQLKDKQRVQFCNDKLAKKSEQARALKSVLESFERKSL